MVFLAPLITLVRGAAAGGGRVPVLSSKAKVASSAPFTNLPTVSLAARNLAVTGDGYYLIPCTYEPGGERPWTVTVFADYPFELSEA